MFKIRKGIFETNSSSVHTLCINKNDKVKVPKSFTFYKDTQFGWSYDTYYDSMSKGDYLYQILQSYAFEEGRKEWESTDTYLSTYKDDPTYVWYSPENYPEYDAIIKKHEDMLKSKIEDILNTYGCTDITWDDTVHEQLYQDGYVDHVHEAHQFFEDMIYNPELLISFLFGDSCIYTGNDNYDGEYMDETVVNSKFDYVFEKGN